MDDRALTPKFLTLSGCALLLALPFSPASAGEHTDSALRQHHVLSERQGRMARDMGRSHIQRLTNRMEWLRDNSGGSSGFDFKLKSHAPAADISDMERQWREMDERHPAGTGDDVNSASPKAEALKAQRKFADEGISLWSQGSVDFARHGNGMLDLDRTNAGLGTGLDVVLSRNLNLGLGLEFDRAFGEAGEDMRVRGQSYGAAFYGSYAPTGQTFVDVAVGASHINFSNTLYLPGEHDMTSAPRLALQGFGSLSVGYEHRQGDFVLSPYGRIEVARTDFGDMAEWAVMEAEGQQQDRNLAVVALRGEYAIHLDNATLRPGARAEWGREAAELAGGGVVAVDRRELMVAPGLNADFGEDWSGGVEYQNRLVGSDRTERFSLRLGRSF
ncbi:autotransporter outer membrane beta-barrel domain-containing protein [Aureimonas fodinaquatilis]|nr:autotransporter outer membrane beta-barrel domain-containing protein [Aureimonas fodinaquatilis]